VCIAPSLANASCPLPPSAALDPPLDAHLRGRGVDLAFFRSSWRDPAAAWLALKVRPLSI